jgi:hypothetical protein
MQVEEDIKRLEEKVERKRRELADKWVDRSACANGACGSGTAGGGGGAGRREAEAEGGGGAVPAPAAPDGAGGSGRGEVGASNKE